MKKITQSFLGVFIIVLTLLSCSKDEANFVVNEESASLEQILNVKLLDVSNNQSIEVTTDYLKEKWEKELLKEGHKVTLGSFSILESKTDNGELIYFLKAISTDGTLETGSFMEFNGKNLNSYTLRGKTCSCTGCPNGCNLSVNGGNCGCTACPPAGGNLSCTKTETIELR
jgi:hypothetical protein